MSEHAETDDRLLQRLIALVGAERFRDAQRRQLETDIHQVCREWFDVVWNIFEAFFTHGDTNMAKARAVVVLYQQAPSYSVLNQGLRIHHRYEDLDREARLYLWQRLRPFLVAPDERAAEPIIYALWEDFFNDPMEDEVWEVIVGDRWPLEEQLLVRLLPRTGPAAPHHKYPLYDRLLAEQPAGRWDNLIYAGLMDAFDYSYALRIDDARAELVLTHLRLTDPRALQAYRDRLAAERQRRTR